MQQDISIFIGFDGKPTRKYGISWSETPTVMGIVTYHNANIS
jgi:hypothetical protein